MKKGLMVALAAIAVTVSVTGCGGDGKLSNDYVTVQGTGNSKSGEERSQ